jgi:hypothetical protein
MGIAPEDKPLAISGRNWGDAVLEGFLLFTISLLVVGGFVQQDSGNVIVVLVGSLNISL